MRSVKTQAGYLPKSLSVLEADQRGVMMDILVAEPGLYTSIPIEDARDRFKRLQEAYVSLVYE
jgi:hypothetical protein